MNPSASGVAFTWSDDGDVRGDETRRRVVSDLLNIGGEWATVDQVHGNRVRLVSEPGRHAPGDALITTTPGLPLAVFTADCLGVVLTGPGAAGVAHAGWRGLAAGVVEAAVDAMAAQGAPPTTAHIGPGIGPCCFEVGDEVAARFPKDVSSTTWGTPSVDLAAAATRRLGAIPVRLDGRCTACGGGLSHRRDATPSRMAALAWLEAGISR